MFDWLRRNQETLVQQVAALEQALGNSLPTLESLPNGQTLSERASRVTAGLVGKNAGLAGATAVPAQAWDGGVDGPRARAGVAGRSGQEFEQAGLIDPPQHGTPPRDGDPPQHGPPPRAESQRDESPELIGSEAAPPPLSRRGSVKRRGRRLVKPEEVERAPRTAEQRLWILDTWKRSPGAPGAAGWSRCRSTRCTVGRSNSPRMVRRG